MEACSEGNFNSFSQLRAFVVGNGYGPRNVLLTRSNSSNNSQRFQISQQYVVPPLIVTNAIVVLLHAHSDGDISAKIADFGLSVRMYSSSFQAEKARERTVANPFWLAPEILREEEYTMSADGMR